MNPESVLEKTTKGAEEIEQAVADYQSGALARSAIRTTL